MLFADVCVTCCTIALVDLCAAGTVQCYNAVQLENTGNVRLGNIHITGATCTMPAGENLSPGGWMPCTVRLAVFVVWMCANWTDPLQPVC